MPSDPTIPPNLRRRGRAAVSNATGRYEAHARVWVDDGWDVAEEDRVARTEIAVERPRSALTRNSSPDIDFDRSINPYRGCEHGCIYCFARPTHAYLGLSPGLDFETRLVARPGIAEVLAKEISRPAYRVAPVAIGTNTDPYQPIEKTHRIMRGVLEVLQRFRHPVTVVTKGSLVERDADILGEMGQAGLARVGISVTTLDPAISRAMEPRAPAPARRLRMIERLSAAGCPVVVMVAPVVPGLTDPEVEAILAAATDAGAAAAGWIMLRLPREVSPLFREWLAERFPDRASRVMGHVRGMHGGRDYDARWGQRMRGEGEYARMIAQRFRLAARRTGLDGKPPALDVTQFAVPGRSLQLDLFSGAG